MLVVFSYFARVLALLLPSNHLISLAYTRHVEQWSETTAVETSQKPGRFLLDLMKLKLLLINLKKRLTNIIKL